MNKTYFRIIVIDGDFVNPDTKWPDCYGPYDVFKSYDDLRDFVEVNAWGMGIKTWDVEEVTFTPDEERFLNVISLEDCQSIIEYCPYCENEVSLKPIFSIQVCPACGEIILPCNLCDHDRCDCANCPLEKIKKDMERNYTKKEK